MSPDGECRKPRRMPPWIFVLEGHGPAAERARITSCSGPTHRVRHSAKTTRAVVQSRIDVFEPLTVIGALAAVTSASASSPARRPLQRALSRRPEVPSLDTSVKSGGLEVVRHGASRRLSTSASTRMSSMPSAIAGRRSFVDASCLWTAGGRPLHPRQAERTLLRSAKLHTLNHKGEILK